MKRAVVFSSVILATAALAVGCASQQPTIHLGDHLKASAHAEGTEICHTHEASIGRHCHDIRSGLERRNAYY